MTIYEELGIRPLINASATLTRLGGSLMPPEVVQAMVDASKVFIDLDELQTKVGDKIAELTHNDACYVSSGAAAGIAIAIAACVTGKNIAAIHQLPDTTGLKDEVIVHKSHRNGYDHAVRQVGVKLVEIGYATSTAPWQLEAAINERTGMMFYLNKAEHDGQIKAEEFVKIGKARGVPTMNDAASDATPKENLWKYTKMGFDLVIFSGGKALRGPQASGLLLGRKDLIEASYPAMSPYGGIGRGMKVGKEELCGLLAAVERYLKVDHAAEWKELEARVATIRAALKGVKRVTTERHIPVIANEVPHVMVLWNEKTLGMTTKEVHERLVGGEPSIHTLQQGPGKLLISVWMMRGDEAQSVGGRLGEIFGG